VAEVAMRRAVLAEVEALLGQSGSRAARSAALAMLTAMLAPYWHLPDVPDLVIHSGDARP